MTLADVVSIIGGTTLLVSAVVSVVQYLLSKLIEARLMNAIKHEYDKKLEEFKFETRRREQSALVSAVLAEWISPQGDYKVLNKLAWEATLWLPDALAKDLHARLSNDSGAKSIKEILIAIKTHLQGSPSSLCPTDIVHFYRNPPE